MNSNNPKKKTPIVLLHGLRGAPIGLNDIKIALEDYGYTVYTPAVPPFANTEPLDNYTPETYADFVADWITTNHLEKPILIGHSMGSMVVAATAAHHPEIINHDVILLSPISERAAPFFRLVSPLASLIPSRIVDYVTSKFLFTGKTSAEFKQVMSITHQCGDYNHNVKRKDLAATTKFSVSYGIGDLLNSTKNHDDKQKFCIIAGAHDRLVSQKSTKALTHRINAKLCFIEDTGHLHNYEKPAETAQLIVDFLERCQ